MQLEAVGEVRRIDPSVVPTAYHCAVVSDGEFEQLRRVENIVRLGRVTTLERGNIVLEQGAMAVDDDALFIDCSTAGIPTCPAVPVLGGDSITPQWVRVCQPTFSAGLIGTGSS